MPASILESVNTALHTALSKKGSAENGLESLLAGSTKKALLANIEFETGGSYENTVLKKLKKRYTFLKSSDTASKPEEENDADDTLKLSKRQLYPIDAVQLGWNNYEWSVGAGMANLGNTCYLNSTLQALFHVPALVNWLMSDRKHIAHCQDSGGQCIICAMRKTLQDSQHHTANNIRPYLIYNKLRLVCRNLIPGRQEDAHEFLRYLVEGMEKAYLSRFRDSADFDSKIKETTPLNQILGGYLRSSVRCMECGHVSTTFQHFQDLLLDIRKAQSLDEALELYFSREDLDDETYKCELCQKKVQATKQFSLERAPMVLCIQLKRFSITNNKITKHISFRQRLEITKYSRQRPNVPLIYRLVSIVTHVGPTVGCGHYTAVAQAPSGNFYQFDDSMVRPISHQVVFNTNAYIMFYELESSPYTQKSPPKVRVSAPPAETVRLASTSNSSASKTLSNGIGCTSDKVYGPQLPPNRVQRPFNGSVTSTNTSPDIETPSTSTSRNDSDNDQERKMTDTAISSTSNESKSTNATQNKNSPTLSSPNVSTSISSLSSPDSTPKKSPHSSPLTKSLVPYESDDTSSSEDANQSPNEVESRVSTKAAVGEWQVTSSTDVGQEASPDIRKWDGVGKKQQQQQTQQNGQSTVVNELFKMTHSGYSAPVSTWSGTRSQMEKEVHTERREDRKRSLADSSDQGRTKHVKTNTGYKSNPGYNPVQEYHNAKNWAHNNNGSGNYKAFYNGNGRHRRLFHHKNYHKNYRYRQ